jgi:hypothetical protein
LKEFFEDFFDKPPQSSEARDLGKEAAVALLERVNTLTNLAANRSLYPFLAELSAPLNRLKELLGKPYTFYLVDFPAQMDSLLELKEKVIAPVLSFWNGPQKGLYDEARQFYQLQAPNFDYLEGDEAARLKILLEDPAVFQGNRMQQVRRLMETLKGKLEQQLTLERQGAIEAVQERQARLAAMTEFNVLTVEQQAKLNYRFETFCGQLKAQTLIAKLRDNLRSFEEREYSQILSQMLTGAQPKPPQPAGRKTGPLVVREPQVEFVYYRSIQVPFDKAWLASETDVEAYLKALREVLLKEVGKGKRIQI